MKFNQFVKIKDFFYQMLAKKEYEVDVFIDSYSLNAVIEYINDGYVLTKSQDEKLKEILSGNLFSVSDIEKFMHKSIPEKYKYFVLTEKCMKVFAHSDNNLNDMPNTKQWLLKKTHNEVAKNLVENWKENFISVKKNKNQQEIDKKIEQIKEFENYIIALDNTEKQKLVDFLNKHAKNSITLFHSESNIKDELENLANYINKLQSKKDNDINSLHDIVKILKEQGESELIAKIDIIDEQYKLLFPEFKDMDKIKRNTLIDLYDKYLIKGLKQYTDIKPKLRNQTINNKNSQLLILENIESIQNIFENELKIIHEQKLMNLSSKSEYVSQLKKQW